MIQAAQNNIPYKSDIQVPGGIASGLTVAIILLGLLYVGLVFAKKKGWLAASLTNPESAVPSRGMRILQRTRITAKTTVIGIEWEGKKYLIVETASSCSLHQVDDGDHAREI